MEVVFMPMIFLTIWAIPLAVYLICAIPALRSLKERGLDDTSRAVWALCIIAIPIMGALAFWILEPGRTARST